VQKALSWTTVGAEREMSKLPLRHRITPGKGKMSLAGQFRSAKEFWCTMCHPDWRKTWQADVPKMRGPLQDPEIFKP